MRELVEVDRGVRGNLDKCRSRRQRHGSSGYLEVTHVRASPGVTRGSSSSCVDGRDGWRRGTQGQGLRIRARQAHLKTDW